MHRGIRDDANPTPNANIDPILAWVWVLITNIQTMENKEEVAIVTTLRECYYVAKDVKQRNMGGYAIEDVIST